jgi:hypothetical protein
MYQDSRGVPLAHDQQQESGGILPVKIWVEPATNPAESFSGPEVASSQGDRSSHNNFATGKYKLESLHKKPQRDDTIAENLIFNLRQKSRWKKRCSSCSLISTFAGG